MTSAEVTTRGVIRAFLAAIESRDLRRIESTLAEDVSWQNVPDPPVVGRREVIEFLADIIRWSDLVRWDVASASYADGVARVDRLDRFWIEGTEHAVRCDGEFEVDLTTRTVRSVRDVVDLDEWRARITPVLADQRRRGASDIATRHSEAVLRGDIVAMAADYALDAVLERAGAVHRGWNAIAGYFDDAASRLTERRVVFGPIERLDDRRAAFDWHVEHSGGVVASGRDVVETADGFITRQVVHLDGADF